jgi:glycine cleavage system T protein (aminomethyltransferase)
MPPRRSPLLEVHTSLGAKLTDFAGWQMPLQYAGIVAEHNAVRNAVGLFDVSHLGKLLLEGRPAASVLQEALTADVAAVEVGRATYSLVLTENGGCIDDVFVYRLGGDSYLVVPNAANVARVADAIRSSGGSPSDEWDRWAILALQGPDSVALFERVFPGHEGTDLPLHSWCTLEVDGGDGFVARTGYTGERGFELYVPAAAAATVFRIFLDEGATPAGLGARDTLRLEMGYPLYGHELTEEINPIEAGLGWTLGWDTAFRGRDALRTVKERGPARRLFGIKCRDRGVPRAGYEVIRGGEKVGTLTSGNFSPTLGTGIGLALGPTASRPEPGEAVEVVARSRRIRGDIVKPPFIKNTGR